MFGKIKIQGTIEVVTGMHIGGSSQFAAIGAVDSPVVRDILTDKPMIPGSSLKGKMRTLLARAYSPSPIIQDHNKDPEIILRLFGSSDRNIKSSRLLFTDMFLSNEEELKAVGVRSTTEVKFENTINRITAVANPRQIERTIRGTEFAMDIIYNVVDEIEIAEDFTAIADGLKLLEYDYIGGHGSRGYGRVKFHDVKAIPVVGNIEESIISKCNTILSDL